MGELRPVLLAEDGEHHDQVVQRHTDHRQARDDADLAFVGHESVDHPATRGGTRKRESDQRGADAQCESGEQQDIGHRVGGGCDAREERRDDGRVARDDDSTEEEAVCERGQIRIGYAVRADLALGFVVRQQHNAGDEDDREGYRRDDADDTREGLLKPHGKHDADECHEHDNARADEEAEERKVPARIMTFSDGTGQA